jgi:hypothetical protein
MRALKAREARPGFFRRLARVVWVVSLTGAALVGGVYWVGTSQCPDPCRIDTPIAAVGKPKAVR